MNAENHSSVPTRGADAASASGSGLPAQRRSKRDRAGRRYGVIVLEVAALAIVAVFAGVLVVGRTGPVATPGLVGAGEGPGGTPTIASQQPASPAAAAVSAASVSATSDPASGASPALLPDPNAVSAVVLATLPPGTTAGDALAVGTLGGQVAEGSACFWIDVPSGDRTALVWPYGFSAAVADSLVVRGPDGQVLARVGDHVQVGGGGPAATATIGPEEDPCGIGRLFRVSVVRSVNDGLVEVGYGSLRLVTRAAGAADSCPTEALPALILVMSDGALRLRTDSGADLDATWPSGFTASPGDRITIAGPTGGVLVTQGVPTAGLHGVLGPTSVEICGAGSETYR